MNSDENIVLIPVFNDWAAISALLPWLARELQGSSIKTSIVLLDDCSTDARPDTLLRGGLDGFESIDIVRMRRNLGHQRAIAVGLSYVARQRRCRAVIIMDGDGEDMPPDVPRLLQVFERTHGKCVVFAQRTRRSEGLIFTVFYWLYRITHQALTGIRVEVGNFSVLSYASVQSLTVVSDLWNHYAAAVVHARLQRSLLPTVRGKRLDGKTSMNFVSLVGHGLSAMSVFADRIGVRLLLFTATLVLILLSGLAFVYGLSLFTPFAVPVSAKFILAGLVLLFGQSAMLSLVFIFMIQMSRGQSSFIPYKEYEIFIEEISRVWPTP